MLVPVSLQCLPLSFLSTCLSSSLAEQSSEGTILHFFVSSGSSTEQSASSFCNIEQEVSTSDGTRTYKSKSCTRFNEHLGSTCVMYILVYEYF